MAQLLVRNLEEDVKERLRRRAALRGRSMEEVRDVLRAWQSRGGGTALHGAGHAHRPAVRGELGFDAQPSA